MKLSILAASVAAAALGMIVLWVVGTGRDSGDKRVSAN
jgi:hypothetical protein